MILTYNACGLQTQIAGNKGTELLDITVTQARITVLGKERNSRE
jgi:hypothetical protein